MRRGHRAGAATVTVLLAITAMACAGAGASAADRDVPLTLANSSGTDAPMFVTIVGHLVDASGGSGPEGYLDADGHFHAFPAGGAGAPTPAPDVSIPGPTSGAASVVDIPPGFSGRLYYSFGEPVGFRLVVGADGRNGLVQPVPWDPAAADSQVGVDFDFVELSYTSYGLYLNSTQVDGMTIPAAVGVTAADGSVTRSGVTDEAMSSIAASLARVPGFAGSVQSDGGVLRLVSPAKLVESGRMADDYLERYLDNVWATYAHGATLTVRPWEDQPTRVFTGSVIGGDLVFRDTTGAVVARFEQPTTADVWRCDGALAAPNDAVVGPIARSLCADINRGTLGSAAVSPATDAATFYRSTPMNEGLFNHYSAAIHAAMQDGAAYGFAFDDVAHQESLVHASSPVGATVDVLPRATGGSGITGSATSTAARTSAPQGSATTATRSVTITLAAPSPGYAFLTLGPGTTGGLLTISVDGTLPRTASVVGPGTTRVDLTAGAGSHVVTVRSTGELGPVALDVPGGGSGAAATTNPPASPSATTATAAPGAQVITVRLTSASPGYAWITLPVGTTAGVVTVTVAGRSATIAVDGPTTTRVDFAAEAGSHLVTVSSTGALGPDVTIHVG